MTLNDSQDLPLPNLRALIDRHGALTIGLAFLRAAFGRRPRPPDASLTALNDHLLRDIGLMPQSPEARAARRGWDM